MDSLFHGDYTQLLNLFSIDGLEITLQKVALRIAMPYQIIPCHFISYLIISAIALYIL